jgi:cytochrome c-type biogenesis protein
MQRLFIALTQAVEGTPLVALSASFIWGILSVLLSPCHLASIPLIVGFISEQGRISTRKAFRLSFIFATGIFITIAVIGMITALLGRIAGDIGRWGNYIVAVVLIFVGLYLLEIVKFPGLRGMNQPLFKQKGLHVAFLLGLLFGVAVGPCTFAYMAPMLAITFKISGAQFVYGISLLLMYAVGHCTVIILAGTLTEFVESYLHWNEKSKTVMVIKKICGLLVILAGLHMFWKA